MFTMKTITRGAAATGVAGLLSLVLATSAFADDHYPTGPTANQAATWEAFLEEEGYEDVECTKITSGWEGDTWMSDGDYLLVALKAGSEQSSDGNPHTVFMGVEKGDPLTTDDEKDISHIIACTGDEDETTPPGTTPPGSTPPGPTGPVVETDVPAQGDSSMPVVLGGAAVLAGLGLAAGAMRRKGQH